MIKLLRLCNGERLWRPLSSLAALLTVCFGATAADVTVTDEHDVVYNVIEGTTDVVVSINNASMFKDRTDAITIPAQVQNHATTTLDHDTWYTVVGFAESAFRSTSISSITIEAPLTELPPYALAECFNLESVTLPHTLTTIAEYALQAPYSSYQFNYARPKLCEVNGMEHVTSIGQYAFYGQTSLLQIDLPEGLTSMGEQAFAYCESLEAVTIPSTLEKMPDYAFYQCIGLKSLTFKKGVKHTGEYSFESCRALKDVTFAEGLTVDLGTFRYAESLGAIKLLPGMKVCGSAFAYGGIESIEWPEEPVELEESAFYGLYYNLKKVTIPAWMTTVPAKLFGSCQPLEEVELSEGVEEIGDGAFQARSTYYTALKKVSFAAGARNTLKKIGESAFASNGYLTEFPFAEGQEFGGSALSSCGFTSITLLKGMKLGDGAMAMARLTEINWPSEAIELGAKPFGTNNLSLTRMEFPAWMDSIPDEMCSYWSALTDIVLPAGLKYIGKRAFFCCNVLKNVDFPDTLEEIDEYAFALGRNQYNSVTQDFTLSFPASLRRIGDYAFQYRWRLKSVGFNEGLETIGLGAFQNAGGFYPWQATLPSTITSLGRSAFQDCAYLTKIDMSKTSLARIQEYTFSNCSRLYSVIWPSTIEAVDNYAFFNADIIFSTTYTPEVIPPSLKTIGMYAFAHQQSSNRDFYTLDLSHVEKIGNRAFDYCRLREVKWPEKEMEIGEYSFANISQMTKATFPAWMKVTPRGMYSGATSLYEIDFNNVETISDYTFANCPYLVCFPLTNTDPTIANRVLSIPSTVQKVGSYAFSGTGIYNNKRYPYILELNEGTEIEASAFENANIADVVWKGCPLLNGSVFKGTPLTSLTLPECMTDIPDNFFNGMTNLTSITLPEKLQTIGRYAFQGCSNLTSITFPPTIREIKEAAFKNSGLTEIAWPDHEVTFGKEAFYGTPITSVTIPAWMQEVPEGMFNGCRSLAEITYEPRGGAPLKIGKYSFGYCQALPSLNLPDEVTELGEGSFYYCSAATALRLPAGITAVPANCFNGCTGLTELDLSNITEMGEYAFASCTKVESIKFNDSLEEIPEGCFNWPNSLTALELPANLRKIGKYGFQNCYKLEELNLPAQLDTIGAQAFREHARLKKIELPASLRYVGELAFAGYSAYYLSTTPNLYDVKYAMEWLKTADQEASRVSQVTEIINHSADLTCGSDVFLDLYNLKTFKSDYPTKHIYCGMFRNCISLESVEFPEGTRFGMVDDYGFANCGSLKEFPYETIVLHGWYAFAGCMSLKQLHFPTGGDYIINKSDPDYNAHFNSRHFDWYDDELGNVNCRDFWPAHDNDNQFQYHSAYLENLQSIVMPYDGRFFSLVEFNIGYTPLRGVSYCYARDIRPQSYEVPKYFEMQKPQPTIRRYGEQWDSYYDQYCDNKESILMVQRGEKWKFMEAGYGRRFNIMEMKNPVPYLDGDIFSEYDAAGNLNHYKAFLRWDVELSDLNEEGDTEAEVWCDGRKLADVTFSRPETIDGSSVGLAVDKVVKTTATLKLVNGETNLTDKFTGQYTYPIELKGGNAATDEHLWIMEQSFQDPGAMYFNAETGARLNAFERYDYRSYYTLVHSFDSPRLDGPIPDHYTYQIKIKGYEYQEYVNNDDFEPGADGHLYHKETFSLPAELTSAELMLYPATGTVKMDFDGMYSTAEVFADRDRSLKPVADNPADRNYRVGALVDPEIEKQQVYVPDYDKVYDVVQNVSTVAYKGGQPEVVFSYSPARTKRRMSELSEDEYTVTPTVGGTYQAVIETYNRGTFGTPPITIPDVPSLTSKLVLAAHEHMPAFIHDRGTFYGQMYLTPDVTPLGYDSSMPAEGDYFLGVWRKLDLYDRDSDWAQGIAGMADETEEAPELIYHTEGRVADISEPQCSDCATGADFYTKGSQMVHTDVFDAAAPMLFNVAYDARLYVKVPAEYTAGEERWVAVDTRQEGVGDVLTGIENVTVDGPGAYGSDEGTEGGDIRWYDLQGRPVAKPVPGEVYIKVTPEGNTKVRFL